MCSAVAPYPDDEYIGAGETKYNTTDSSFYCLFVHIKDDGTTTIIPGLDFQLFDTEPYTAQGKTVEYYKQTTATDKAQWIKMNTRTGGPPTYACLTGKPRKCSCKASAPEWLLA